MLQFISVLAAAVIATPPLSAHAQHLEDSTMHTPTQTEGRNRLADETSPYLLQHQHNPVHWYAWGDNAFTAAREQDKPIFLSVGYSTCYWCHVMERESFEDPATAAVMNEHFICIKVDREERPDVDDIYMDAVRLLSRGNGGWPMSVWMEPKGLKPFAGGTYFPKHLAHGRPSFTQVLEGIADAWDNRRAEVEQTAARVASAVQQMNNRATAPVALGQKYIDWAATRLGDQSDPVYAGFGSPPNYAPKFPTPVNLDFLIEAAWDSSEHQGIVTSTLDRMATGGMYDQVGGGFHRYSTDRQWLVPHFEKMLYDNGQLASTYARAYALTGDAYYAEIVRETLDYVLREMADAGGAFWSAQDAEVDAREGKNYLWTEGEIRETLAAAGLADDAAFALRVYGVDQGTNFRDPHHPEEDAANVLHLIERPDALVASSGEMTQAEFDQRLARVNEALYAERMTRKQPGTDDKVLTGWNGLMIAGLADGGRILNEQQYIDAAQRAADFILSDMRSSEGRLLRTYRDGTAKIDAFLEDYALFVYGLLALHEATDNECYLNEARDLTAVARVLFWDADRGGWYDTRADQADLFVRTKGTYDGAVPSGNSMMLNNLLTLSERTDDAQDLADAEQAVAFLSPIIAQQPTACILSVKAYHRLRQIADADTAAAPTFTLPGVAPAEPAHAAPGPVHAAVDRDSVTIEAGGTTTINVTIRIDAGYHINAHEPGSDFLIPLSVTLSGAPGVSATPRYPQGAIYHGPLAAGDIRIHEDTVTIPVELRADQPMSADATLHIITQACTDRACLAPTTDVVALRITCE